MASGQHVSRIDIIKARSHPCLSLALDGTIRARQCSSDIFELQPHTNRPDLSSFEHYLISLKDMNCVRSPTGKIHFFLDTTEQTVATVFGHRVLTVDHASGFIIHVDKLDGSL